MNNPQDITNNNHFNKRIGDSDVNEEIDVYKDYINYENYCPCCWAEYYKFYYKIEGDKLLVKCFEFVKYKGQSSEKYYIKNGEILQKNVNLKKDIVNTRDELTRKYEFIREVYSLIKWHELRPYGMFTFSRNAINWIKSQIKRKNY